MITIEECVSLKPFNTFGISAVARFFAEATTIDGLQTLVNVFSENQKPRLILGGGSNLLLTDDFDGIVFYPNLMGVEIDNQTESEIWVRAYAGENWDKFVAYCVSRNWGGLENLSLIPGNVGACPVQNIGAYGVEVKDVIDSVEAIDMKTSDIRIFRNAECKFGYRDSIFKNELKGKYIIASVVFKLSKKPECKVKYNDVAEELKNFSDVNIGSVRQAIINIRRRKLPDQDKLGNAGSFFKNPVVPESVFRKIQANYPDAPFHTAGEGLVKIPAAWLIQTCGWKGIREGNVGSYPSQPLVLVNYGGATGPEIIEFATRIQQSVFERLGVELEMEVNIV